MVILSINIVLVAFVVVIVDFIQIGSFCYEADDKEKLKIGN